MSSHRLVKFAQMCLPAHTHFSVVETNCLNSLNMNHLQVSGWLIFVFGGCCYFGVLFSVRMSWLRYSLPAWFLLLPGILSKGTACTCWWLCKRARLCGLRLVIHPLPGLGELGAESMQENERKCQMFDEAFATLMVKKQAINNKQKTEGALTWPNTLTCSEFCVSETIEKVTNGMKQESPETEPHMDEAGVCNYLSCQWGETRLQKLGLWKWQSIGQKIFLWILTLRHIQK